jgi:hypothetical protein
MGVALNPVPVRWGDVRRPDGVLAFGGCNNMAFPAPRMNYRYLTPCVIYRGYLAQITTSLDFKH